MTLAGAASLADPAQIILKQEEALIRRLCDGENEVFYQLIRPYERRVYATAFAVLRNEADAEEVAQEAFLKAFKHIRQFRGEAESVQDT